MLYPDRYGSPSCHCPSPRHFPMKEWQECHQYRTDGNTVSSYSPSLHLLSVILQSYTPLHSGNFSSLPIPVWLSVTVPVCLHLRPDRMSDMHIHHLPVYPAGCLRTSALCQTGWAVSCPRSALLRFQDQQACCWQYLLPLSSSSGETDSISYIFSFMSSYIFYVHSSYMLLLYALYPQSSQYPYTLFILTPVPFKVNVLLLLKLR